MSPLLDGLFRVPVRSVQSNAWFKRTVPVSMSHLVHPLQKATIEVPGVIMLLSALLLDLCVFALSIIHLGAPGWVNTYLQVLHPLGELTSPSSHNDLFWSPVAVLGFKSILSDVSVICSCFLSLSIVMESVSPSLYL